jgi:hypothetical protein
VAEQLEAAFPGLVVALHGCMADPDEFDQVRRRRSAAPSLSVGGP